MTVVRWDGRPCLIAVQFLFDIYSLQCNRKTPVSDRTAYCWASCVFSVVRSGATVLYEGSCIQIQPPNPEVHPQPVPPGIDVNSPCYDIPTVYEPVCASFGGRLMEYGNIYQARCEYVSLFVRVGLSLSLSVYICDIVRKRVGVVFNLIFIRFRSYWLSNALHSSIGQNIKSHLCPVSVIRCPFPGHCGQSVKNFKWP